MIVRNGPGTSERRRGPRAGLWTAVLSVAALTACAARVSEGDAIAAQGPGVRVASSQGGAVGFIEVDNRVSVVEDVAPVRTDAAWSVMGDVFETLGIEPTTRQRGSMEMGNERFVARRIDGRALSTFIDCGASFGRDRADQYEVTMQILVRLGPAADGGTRVTTLLDAYARPRDVAGNAYHCTSKGTLERRVVELVAEAAGA